MNVLNFFFSFCLVCGCAGPQLTARSEAEASLTTFRVRVRVIGATDRPSETNIGAKIADLLVEMRMGIPVQSGESAQLAIDIEVNRYHQGKANEEKFIWYLSDVSDGTILASETLHSWADKDQIAAEKILASIAARFDMGTYENNEKKAKPTRIAERPKRSPYPSSQTDGSRDYAIIIGIEKYRNEIKPALYAQNDATMMKDIFETTFNIPPENIKILINESASKTDVSGAIFEWLPKNATHKNGRVFIFFSGHGSSNVETGSTYILPYDADPSYLKTGGILVDDIRKSLAQLKSKNTYLFIDSSFSGNGPRSVLPKGMRPILPMKKNSAQTTITLSAARANQSAEIHTMAQNGLFTHYLIQGLSGKSDLNSDRSIALDELSQYLSSHVARDSKKQNQEQNPLLNISEGNDPRRIILIHEIEQ